jgi:hypothetical protein
MGQPPNVSDPIGELLSIPQQRISMEAIHDRKEYLPAQEGNRE